ncbi:MAG TPA: carbamate kinase [Candidatus Aminicenantes bacterium]|nr:carbamate kinase [Candidatus Aminicenantes bacterium]
MKKKLALVAFGGNAMLPPGERGTAAEQSANACQAAQLMVEVVRKGYELIVVHGNGPQVGNLLLQMEAASSSIPPFPLDVCDAMTQGSMGYLLERAICNELRKHSLRKEVVTVLTQVVVDPEDPGFAHPEKPIGPFYSRERAEVLRVENRWQMVEDAGRGFRRVVPSPTPIDVVPKKAISALVNQGQVVIAAGGGGVPVIINEDGLVQGIEAVIDKDRVSALIAAEAGADLFVILTGVDRVWENFGKPDARPLPVIGVDTARKMLQAKQFPPGSMGPKIESAIAYIEGGGREVLITSAEKLKAALAGRSGTRIVRQTTETRPEPTPSRRGKKTSPGQT